MTFKTDDFYVGKRLFVGEGFPIALGIGPAEARGSAYIEGPTITGAPLSFPIPQATAMIGPNRNSEVVPPVILVQSRVLTSHLTHYQLLETLVSSIT